MHSHSFLTYYKYRILSFFLLLVVSSNMSAVQARCACTWNEPVWRRWKSGHRGGWNTSGIFVANYILSPLYYCHLYYTLILSFMQKNFKNSFPICLKQMYYLNFLSFTLSSVPVQNKLDLAGVVTRRTFIGSLTSTL